MSQPQPRVRFIGSRALHRELPKVLESLDNPDNRYVLTIHSRPRAVLIGTEAFLELLRGQTPSDRLLALQLEALVQGQGGAAALEAAEADQEEANRHSEENQENQAREPNTTDTSKTSRTLIAV